MRERVVLTLPRGGGEVCEQQSLVETQGCMAMMCNETAAARVAARDCQWGQWSAYTACTGTSGQRFRHREIEVPAAAGGIECDAENSEETARCQREGASGFCIWLPWGEFGACSATCGAGQQQRSRG